MSLKLVNARIWDGLSDNWSSSRSISISDGRVAAFDSAVAADETIDLQDRAVLPGFIDAHFHAYASHVDVPHLETLPLSYIAHHASGLLSQALDRGFTTVRDAGGADWGLAQALADGLTRGPRLLRAGKALSQTGGHGDKRATHSEPCGCRMVANLSQIADGVDEVRFAARETLRQGADHIKIFVSGGVSSPTDPIWMTQYSAEEIRAVVDEAESRRTYVMAHAYGPDAIMRAVENGVRSIEHGNLLDERSAAAMAANDAYLVPTLITYHALATEGASLGLSDVSKAKLADVVGHGANAVRIARQANVKVGFGTDLLGPLHKWQSHEFRLRGQIEDPVSVLRSATSVNASLINRDDLGVIGEGSVADLVVVDGDPLDDLACLWEKLPAMVFQRGNLVSDRRQVQ
jgi:imidazolonepropionase-like amidohydrolase